MFVMLCKESLQKTTMAFPAQVPLAVHHALSLHVHQFAQPSLLSAKYGGSSQALEWHSTEVC